LGEKSGAIALVLLGLMAGRLAGRLAGWQTGWQTGWLVDKIVLNLKKFKIIYRMKYSSFYYV